MTKNLYFGIRAIIDDIQIMTLHCKDVYHAQLENIKYSLFTSTMLSVMFLIHTPLALYIIFRTWFPHQMYREDC